MTRLLYAALGILVAGAVFSAVTAVIWPEHDPAWAVRASSAGLLGAMLLVAAELGRWLAGKRKDGGK